MNLPLPNSRADPMATRLRRVVAILVELQHTPATRAELAVRHGVSERQISADITLLRQAGVRVTVRPYRAWLPQQPPPAE
jgi:predicted DNA-binding transcriptional regulator YafY